MPHTTPAASYAEHQLGPLGDDAGATALYLDLVKRAVVNILYEDIPSWVFDRTTNTITAADRFHLAKRVSGDDGPTAAHTMIGMHRLNNLQHCLEDVIREKVPGDLIETGVLGGGATIFMRAVLKAYGDTTRRVFVCDSFVPQPTSAPPAVVQWALKAAASVPHKAWQHDLFQLLQKVNPSKSLPDTANPSDELVDHVMQVLREGDKMAIPTRDTSLAGVQSNFARYGLLDDQVVFVKGYFSDTLPSLDATAFAVLRLDGDLFASTMDALTHVYPKLSPGGYCIIDDFSSFTDCRRAVEEYRATHQITDPIQSIDDHGVFWKKS